MCTLSWVRTSGGYELFFNRDEALRRECERPPTEESTLSVRYLAPTDGAAGGTWIAANEFGLTTCLLNAYKPSLGAIGAERESRGMLVRELAGCQTSAAARHALLQTDLRPYEPFVLFVIDGESELLAEWDGAELRTPASEGRMPLVSSGFDQPGAKRERPAVLQQLLAQGRTLNPDLLHDFHASHLPSRGAYSPCMHRSDAETRSFVHIALEETRVHLDYLAAPPCTRQIPQRSTLRLRSSAPSSSPARFA